MLLLSVFTVSRTTFLQAKRKILGIAYQSTFSKAGLLGSIPIWPLDAKKFTLPYSVSLANPLGIGNL